MNSGRSGTDENANAGERDFRWGSLFAAGFYRRNGSKIRWNVIDWKCFDVHFHEAHERTAVVRSLPAAAIDDHTDTDDLAAVRTDDIHRFLDPAAASYDIFGNDEPLVRPDLEPAPERESAGLFLDEDMTFPEGAADFLTNDDSAQSRRDHSVGLDVSQFVRKPAANVGRDLSVLE